MFYLFYLVFYFIYVAFINYAFIIRNRTACYEADYSENNLLQRPIHKCHLKRGKKK